jgi:RNA polymerase sigma factor for flagellar operon FliA
MTEASVGAAPEADPPSVAEAALWTAWRERGDSSAREQLVLLHSDFSRIMAGKLYARRVTDEVGFDEYLQMAHMATIECVDRYDPAYEASFRTFASHRITGAILNGLESMSERSRQLAVRRRVERERLASLRDGEPDAGQDRFDRLAAVAVGLAIGFLLEQGGSDGEAEAAYADNAYERTLMRQIRERVAARVSELPDREALVIRHHYLQNIPFEEIARHLGVSKGRVSQLHRQALKLLRQSLGSADALDLNL